MLTATLAALVVLLTLLKMEEANDKHKKEGMQYLYPLKNAS
jgi:hypothetical protein